MKKSELTQLTQIIEHIVAKEVRKQLPTIIAETFQNMMGKRNPIVEERQPVTENIQPEQAPEEEINLKTSLREMFAGTNVMGPPPENRPRQPKQFTKNPVLNQILNETIPDLGSRERLVGSAAMAGGYSPTLNMIPGFNPNAAIQASEGESFMRNVPTMPTMQPSVAMPRASVPTLVEGQVSNHAPLAELPTNISALDVARQVPMAPAITRALTRNYSQVMKLIDKKQKGIA